MISREMPMIVPLSINGVTSYFLCQKSTRSKFEDGDVLRICFTAEAPYWNLPDREFSEHEVEMKYLRHALV